MCSSYVFHLMKIKRYLIIDISFVAMTTNLYAYSLYRFGVSENIKILNCRPFPCRTIHTLSEGDRQTVHNIPVLGRYIIVTPISLNWPKIEHERHYEPCWPMINIHLCSSA